MSGISVHSCSPHEAGEAFWRLVRAIQVSNPTEGFGVTPLTPVAVLTRIINGKRGLQGRLWLAEKSGNPAAFGILYRIADGRAEDGFYQFEAGQLQQDGDFASIVALVESASEYANQAGITARAWVFSNIIADTLNSAGWQICRSLHVMSARRTDLVHSLGNGKVLEELVSDGTPMRLITLSGDEHGVIALKASLADEVDLESQSRLGSSLKMASNLTASSGSSKTDRETVCVGVVHEKSGRLVGISEIQRKSRHIWISTMTGVMHGFRRKGLAYIIKRYATSELLRRNEGFRELISYVDDWNIGIFSTNTSIGYRDVRYFKLLAFGNAMLGVKL